MKLTTTEAAERLGVSPRRVLALITAGRLRARKVGRDWQISPRALAEVQVRTAGRPPWTSN